MKSTIFIALNITVFIALVFAWSERWTYGPKITSSEGDGKIAVYKKDNWTGQIWITQYTSSSEDFLQPAYGVDEVPFGEKEWPRVTLTIMWSVLTLLSLFFSIYGILSRIKKEN
ncbi:hypothetical protein [Heyndrickxia oleronia]|uniref:hypothetical protein n=1 Tax=Heyndrickxia oleronia TaxID=38875 RepID=UPI001B01424A|nr:hypothetical protein [Heyndrickxia oleronia]GIN38368.1 hypothetical protein J19TS1_13170 [Heyndrickxia oleronia]